MKNIKTKHSLLSLASLCGSGLTFAQAVATPTANTLVNGSTKAAKDAAGHLQLWGVLSLILPVLA